MLFTTDEKYLYVKNKINKNGQAWTCRSGCGARIQELNGVCTFGDSYSGHNHEKHQIVLELENKLKAACSKTQIPAD